MSGILITNYLPRFNGISSNDRRHGWGEEKGTLYQKEYIEFFIDPCYLERLQSILQESSSLNYLISNQSGTIQMTNWPQHPLTISWGKFPSKSAPSSLLSPLPASWHASLADSCVYRFRALLISIAH